MTGRQIAYVLLILSLIALGLTILAHHWDGQRRMKIAVIMILVAYCASYGLR